MKSMKMDTLTPKHSSSSSGCSTASSTTDIKTPKKLPRDAKSSGTRSRSFLYCISKHLGRHFLHHHRRHHDTIYNSQEDVRSSSTDSFSLSFERASVHKGGSLHITSSSIDLTSDEHTSRTSSVSPCSRFSTTLCPLDNEIINEYQHIYVDTLYRPSTALDRNGDLSTSEEEEEEEEDEDGNADDGDDEGNDGDGDGDSDYEQHLNTKKHLDIPRASAPESTSPRSTSSIGSKSGGLHLSRISISSSVSRMLHHLSASASTRSLSCSSTPLRCFKDRSLRLKASLNNKSSSTKKSITSSKSVPATSTSTLASNSSNANGKKKDKKQQSILRPPIHYVYMKGMSGLYSRVPRYTVCCPYSMQQFA